MTVSHYRPPVGDLIFQLYGRPVHPELFDILATRTVVRDDYRLNVWITSAGHVITFENANVFLTEVAASSEQDLPEKRRLLHRRLRNERTNSLPCAHGVQYQVCFQVEVLPPHLFAVVHGEILQDGAKRGMIHYFPSTSRFELAPLGYITAEASPSCLFLSSFHTFPSEYTVVKTQSLIEIPH